MAGIFACGLVGGLGAIIGYANLPTRWTLGATVPTVKYLAEGRLRMLEPGKNVLEAKEVSAKELFDQKSPMLIYVVRRPGCSFCRSQAQIISEQLGPKLEEKKVSLKHFYGPKERWMPMWMGFLRLSTYTNYAKSKAKGNTEGEGRLLGGMYLLDKNQEMVFSHLERQWGDQVDPKELSNALDKL